MQSQDQSHDVVSVLEIDTLIPDQFQQSSEPYYSNEDIAVLHDVITAAQLQLDESTLPKPLPAAALFKAYDEVLPQHGIDPDSDHHLSAFIFRVGGEQGDSTLSHKFRTILDRMGIVLQFGDDYTQSTPSRSTHFVPQILQPAHDSDGQSRNSPSDNAAKVRLKDYPKGPFFDSVRIEISPQEFPVLLEPGNGNDLVSKATRRSLVPAVRQQTTPKRQGYPNSDPVSTLLRTHADTVVPSSRSRGHKPQPEQRALATQLNPSSLAPSSLASVVNRLHDAVNKQSQLQEGLSQIPRLCENIVHDEGTGRHQIKTAVQPSSNSPCMAVQMSEINATTYSSRKQNSAFTQMALKDGHGEYHSFSSSPNDLAVNLIVKNERPTAQLKHEILLNRATRARQIYLASKFFNYWMDRTATRLEREGVARRHIVRFRCFRRWFQRPAFRSPMVEQLKIIIVIEKLRRAVAYQEQQLNLAVSQSLHTYYQKAATGVLCQWLGHLRTRDYRRWTTDEAKLRVAKLWMSCVAANCDRGRNCLSWRAGRSVLFALLRWNDHRDHDYQQVQTARQLGAFRRLNGPLAHWRHQIQAENCASDYQQRLLLKSSSQVFIHWNILGRAKSFQWRTDYVHVSQQLDKWNQSFHRYQDSLDKASSHYESHCMRQYWYQMSRARSARLELFYSSNRARLFIVASRTLAIFEAAVKKRKDEMREDVRHYLMVRYTQASSVRKRRNFFKAFDQWRTKSRGLQFWDELAMTQIIRHHDARLENTHLKWRRRTFNHTQVQNITTRYFEQQLLAMWQSIAKRHNGRDADGWEAWMTGKSEQYLKEWSISSLQRSGQAHLALLVHRKFNSEKRSRVFQCWRQTCQLPGYRAPGQDFRRTMKFRVSDGHKRATSTGQYLLRDGLCDQDGATPSVETPTRWTGAPLSMSLAFSSHLMPPVREVDETSVNFIEPGNEELSMGAKSALLDLRTGSLPSTTPLAPLPVHLRMNPKPDIGIPAHPTPLPFSQPLLKLPLRRSGIQLQDSAPGIPYTRRPDAKATKT